MQVLLRKLTVSPGAVDLHIQQPYDYPQINVDVDRSKAPLLGLTEQNVASNMLVSLSGSFQTTPSFWIDPKTGTQYNVVAQTPQFRLTSLNDLGNTPLSQTRHPPAAATSQILSQRGDHRVAASHPRWSATTTRRRPSTSTAACRAPISVSSPPSSSE